jgi:hypothetical protein
MFPHQVANYKSLNYHSLLPLRKDLVSKQSMRLSLHIGSPGVRYDSKQDCTEKGRKEDDYIHPVEESTYCFLWVGSGPVL